MAILSTLRSAVISAALNLTGAFWPRRKDGETEDDYVYRIAKRVMFWGIAFPIMVSLWRDALGL